MKYTKKTPRLDITVDDETNTILVQQRWKYEWKCDPGTTPWTLAQKRKFHSEANQVIWRKWSTAFKLKGNKKSKPIEKNKDPNYTINFDIEWVNINHHWEVNVRKILPGFIIESKLNWEFRKIYLDTEDIKVNDKPFIGKQIPLIHEFGHAIGNTPFTTQGDEYLPGGKFFKDTNSIMHCGMIIRKRHFDFIIRELNTIIPETLFSI